MELAGGGWYGGGSAGNYSSSSRTRATGGGGGSGYVWTSSTASNAPSGYLVDTKYYLTEAGTYGSGETGFINNPNTDGNGYARITLITAEKDVEVIESNWINIEKQIENGSITGTFNYNENTITATPLTNTAPIINGVNVSSKTATTATITATASDLDGDTITYTLEINGNTYTSETGDFRVTGLTESTTYSFTVKANDGYMDTPETGNLTTKEVPIINTVAVSNLTASRATITVNATDGDGDSLTYTLEINEKTYTSTTGVFSVTGLSQLTTYSYTVKVSDTDNETATKTESLTTLANTAPVIATNLDYKNGKTTTQFTIQMSATDVDGDNLIYKLYASTSQNGTYYQVGTTTGTAGTAKTIAATAINGTTLTMYTDYWWYIEVTDGIESVKSDKQTLKTYCSGSTMTCSLARKCSASDYRYNCSVCGTSGTCPGTISWNTSGRISDFQRTCVCYPWRDDSHYVPYGVLDVQLF